MGVGLVDVAGLPDANAVEGGRVGIGGYAGENEWGGSGDEDSFVIVAGVEEDGLRATVVRSARVRGGERSVLTLSFEATRRYTSRPPFSDRKHPF